ncbi:MarR family winged helix-turn-helix transcriptional regulator [Actinoallomurus sp. NPDC050550]|uniref:MarR family winged helix-turn-helix transcriptional regulator n=1 Tax=Actinoallomurus sp. NPDC050550 TaxID=3154937 RepID=UPI0034012A2E
MDPIRQREALTAVERAMVAIRRSQTRRAMSRLGRDLEGVTFDPTVFGVLDAIEGMGRPCTVTEVAAALDVDQPRASRLVARAVDAGLLVRQADQRDGRRTPVALTDRAREQLDRMHRFRQETFARAMADWPDDDRATFARLLTSFVESFTALTAAPGAGETFSGDRPPPGRPADR